MCNKSRQINIGSLEFSSCFDSSKLWQIHFICWLKLVHCHTKTFAMTSCQDIDISFISPVLIDSLFSKIIWKQHSRGKLVHLVYGFRRWRWKYLNSDDGAVGALEEETLTKVCVWSSPINFYATFWATIFFAHWLTILRSRKMEL